MSTLFVLRNQDQLFLDKHGEWIAESQAKLLFQTTRKDEAINQMVEISLKHPDLRIFIDEIPKPENPGQHSSHKDLETSAETTA